MKRVALALLLISASAAVALANPAVRVLNDSGKGAEIAVNYMGLPFGSYKETEHLGVNQTATWPLVGRNGSRITEIRASLSNYYTSLGINCSETIQTNGEAGEWVWRTYRVRDNSKGCDLKRR